MKAFDTDILTEILIGTPATSARAAAIPLDQQGTPIVVIEEIIRGRLDLIRRAESGKTSVSIESAYHFLERTLQLLSKLRVFPFTAQAEAQFQQWRQQKIRVSTHDLRIGAVCVTQTITLITSNRRDFERVPGLSVEYWT